MKKKLIWLVPLAIVGICAFVAFGGWIVQQLWNWLAPSLFGLRQITFWQGLGILALCRILFGGFGFHDSGSGPKRMARHMTEEEKQQWRRRMLERCGMGPAATPESQG